MLAELIEALVADLEGVRLEVAPAPAGLGGLAVRLLARHEGAWEPVCWWADGSGQVRTWSSVQAALEAASDLIADARDCPRLRGWPVAVALVVAEGLAVPGLVLDAERRPVSWVV